MKKVALLILDGWGHGDHSKSDGIFHAKTPFMDSLEKNVANAELLTHGEHVGLPAGQMGNSEVGHLNIGAGRIVYQELSRINKSIADGEFEKNETLLKAFALARQNNKPVHLMGLVSDGGVHASAEHLYALCDFAKALNLLPQLRVISSIDLPPLPLAKTIRDLRKPESEPTCPSQSSRSWIVFIIASTCTTSSQNKTCPHVSFAIPQLGHLHE